LDESLPKWGSGDPPTIDRKAIDLIDAMFDTPAPNESPTASPNRAPMNRFTSLLFRESLGGKMGSIRCGRTCSLGIGNFIIQ
jgi:hypothetical protein